jgi:uncharacterized protein (TIGR03382 family)
VISRLDVENAHIEIGDARPTRVSMFVRPLGVVLALVSSTALASADRGFDLARQGVVTPPPAIARAQSRTIYLNRDGVSVTPGKNDARINRSSVATEPATIPAWPASPELWSATRACLETMYEPFDVTFTEVDPGDVPHIEAVFGGTPGLLGQSPRIGGIAPMSTSCSVVETAMVFAFTAVLPQNAQIVCEVMAQEIAHSYGLDHELLPADPMTYLRFEGKRAFQDELAACGETTARPCGLDGSTCRAKQNSYALLLERLGAAGTNDDPSETGDVTETGEPRSGQPVDEIGYGCSTSGSGAGLAIGLASVVVRRRRRRR